MLTAGSPSRHEAAVTITMLPGWFADLPGTSRSLFLSIAMVRRYLPGQALLHAGDPDGGMLGIVRGSVEVHAGSASPDSSFIFMHFPGAWIGYGPILCMPRVLDAYACTTVDALLLPETALRGLLERHPELWKHVAELAYLDMLNALGGCADLLIYPLRQRLAAVLLWLTGVRSKNRADSAPLRMTQTELAKLLHTSRSSLAPMLVQFERLGLIKAGYAAIWIQNPDALRAIADANC